MVWGEDQEVCLLESAKFALLILCGYIEDIRTYLMELENYFSIYVPEKMDTPNEPVAKLN